MSIYFYLDDEINHVGSLPDMSAAGVGFTLGDGVLFSSDEEDEREEGAVVVVGTQEGDEKGEGEA